MDKIVDKFYNESIQNGSNQKPRLTSNKFSSPNLLGNRYNVNKRYDNGQRIIENSPVPRTQYSMGLNAPTMPGNPPLFSTVTNPFKKVENPYSTLRRNYEPDVLKMNILDNRIKEMEEENKRNKLKIQRLMEGDSFGHQKPFWNNNYNYVNNPNNLNEAMDNLRQPYLTMEEFRNKQNMRRNQVQYELQKARQRINEDRNIMNDMNNINNNDNNNIIIEQQPHKERKYTISNYTSEESSEDDEIDKKMKKEYNELLKELKEEKEYNERYNIDEKLESMIRQNNYKNEEINLLRQKNLEMYNQLKSKEEAEDFINNIPDHVALQLQNDNFKIRSNLNTIKNSFREIKNDLENKLEELQMKQNYNFEIIKKIIEDGGNRKFKAGFRKYYNGEEIDLNNVEDEMPEHLQFLPDLIEKKIKENEEKKNAEKNRLIQEKMNHKFDSMEYNYGYGNKFYKYKNNYQPMNKNNNFVISKNYGRFQYIPKKNNNNDINQNKNEDSFKEKGEQNLMIMREKEKNIPGLYAYGVGNKNMNNRIPVRMNGCYDDWFKDKNKGEFKIEESQSEVGINAIKKQIKVKSNKSESLKSKKITNSKSASKSSSESDKKSTKKKSSKNSKKSENKKDKKDKDDKKDKKDKKDKDDKKDKNKDDNESSEESDEESDESSDESDDESDEESDDDSDSDKKESKSDKKDKDDKESSEISDDDDE